MRVVGIEKYKGEIVQIIVRQLSDDYDVEKRVPYSRRRRAAPMRLPFVVVAKVEGGGERAVNRGMAVAHLTRE